MLITDGMLHFRTLDNGLPHLEIAGSLEESGLDALAKAFGVLDAEPVIIVSFDESTYLDRKAFGEALTFASDHSGEIVFVIPKGVGTRLLPSLPATDTLHVVEDFRRAAALGEAIRDLSAVSFSRDGVAERPSGSRERRDDD